MMEQMFLLALHPTGAGAKRGCWLWVYGPQAARRFQEQTAKIQMLAAGAGLTEDLSAKDALKMEGLDESAICLCAESSALQFRGTEVSGNLEKGLRLLEGAESSILYSEFGKAVCAGWIEGQISAPGFWSKAKLACAAALEKYFLDRAAARCGQAGQAKSI